MESLNRKSLATQIAARLNACRVELSQEFLAPDRIHSFVLDDLLPAEVTEQIGAAFPPLDRLVHHSTLREKKRIGVELGSYDPLCAEALYAFQDLRVVEAIAAITGIETLEPDPELYAGGLSSMGDGDFLNPHLDNSHDRSRNRYRALNLLYYVSPGWQMDYGGNFELWDQGTQGEPRVVVSAFNRLVVMITDRTSWHSVQPVKHDGRRNCVSNYYFSAASVESGDYFHVTSFRGRPEQKIRDVVLRLDHIARNGLRKVFPHGVRKTTHVYKPKQPVS